MSVEDGQYMGVPASYVDGAPYDDRYDISTLRSPVLEAVEPGVEETTSSV